MTNATARGADRERVRSLSLEAMPMKQFLVLSKSSVPAAEQMASAARADESSDGRRWLVP